VHNTRPESITVTLYANGVAVNAKPTWSNTKSDTWSYKFENLPAVDDSGATIRYTVRETTVDGYESSVDGTTITNKLIPKEPTKYGEIKGVKTWVEGNSGVRNRPTSITVHLLRNGVEIDSLEVTAETGWNYTFGTRPLDDGYGNNYTYTVREDGVPGYFSRVNGMDLFNMTLAPDNPDGPNPNPHNEIPNRKTPTPRPRFEEFTEEEMTDVVEMLDYGTPLWGQLLGTGDETPVYPYVFGGVGAIAVIALAVFGRKRKKKKGN
jgi:LPXTG-motif cell wall-anchored protein